MNLSILVYLNSIAVSNEALGIIATIVSGPLSYVVFPCIFTLFLLYRYRFSLSVFSFIFLSTFFSWFTARLLKEIFRIPRPFETFAQITELGKSSGFSFPSEHAAVYGAFCVIFFLLNKKIGFLVLIVMLMVMLSRVMVGAHYPIDVLVGMSVGMIITYSMSALFKYTKLWTL